MMDLDLDLQLQSSKLSMSLPLSMDSKSKYIIPKRNVGIFWDVVNCPIPVPLMSPVTQPEVSVSSVVNLLRHVFVRDRSDFHEVKFTVITDSKSVSSAGADELAKISGSGASGTEAGPGESKLSVIEIDKARRPAQRVLRDEIREFIKNYGHTSPVLVLVCDHIQLLVKEIAYYKLEYDCYIALVYGPVCTFQLLPQWDEVYYFQTFCERLVSKSSSTQNSSASTLPDASNLSIDIDSTANTAQTPIVQNEDNTIVLDLECKSSEKNPSLNLRELKKQVYALKKVYENSILSKSGIQVQSHSFGKYKFWISFKNSKGDDGGDGEDLRIEEKLKKFFAGDSGVTVERAGGADGAEADSGNDVWITFNDADVALKNVEKLIRSPDDLLGKNFSLVFVNNYLQKDINAKKYYIINRSESDEVHELKERIWNMRQVSAEDESIAKYFLTLTGFPTDLSPNEIQDDLVSFLEEISVKGTIEYVSMDSLACISFQQYEDVGTTLNGINSPLFYDGSGYKLKMDAISSKQVEDLVHLKPTMLVTPCCEEKSIITG